MPEENLTLKEKFQKALDKVGDAVKDAGTLDVVTMSGKIDVSIDTGKFNISDFYNSLLDGDGKVKAGMNVVAITHVDVDNDRFNFVETDADPTMVDLHNDAVLASQEARNAFLDFIKGFIKES